ncbi:MAG: HAD hydrolase-like protein [Eubacteriales bacterium]
MFQYILFDLDGTLTDSKLGITRCVAYALERYGIIEEDLSKLEIFIGPPLRDSFMEFYGFDAVKAEEAVAVYRERFSTIGLYENEVYEGVVGMLHRLKAAGKDLAIASSKPTVFVQKILEHFEIKDCFSVVIGSFLDGTRDKKEEVVEAALEELLGEIKGTKENTAMIGDRKFDIQGAKEHGITAVGVGYGFANEGELEEAGADYIVETVTELEALLLQ